MRFTVERPGVGSGTLAGTALSEAQHCSHASSILAQTQIHAALLANGLNSSHRPGVATLAGTAQRFSAPFSTLP